MKFRVNRADGSTDESPEGQAKGATVSTNQVSVALSASGDYEAVENKTRRGLRVRTRYAVLDVEILDGQNRVRVKLTENSHG